VQRRAAGDDRRRVELSLTPRGRGLEERVHEARQSVLDLGRQLLGDRDVAPALELMRELIQYSSFAELIERRRALVERDPHTARPR
jgi:DNA-binding MarR family transcriptional regulator